MTYPVPSVRGRPSPREASLAMLAHDMRGALQGVTGGVALIDPADLPEAARAQFERVTASALALGRLVDLLLAEAHGGAGVELAPAADLGACLDEIERRWRGEALERGRRLVSDVRVPLPVGLRVPSVVICRILSNLILNALRHAESGDVRLSVEPATEGGLILRVSDAGSGIPDAVIDSVLRRTGRLVSASGDGHGLGLHIVRDLCAEAGARFGLRNAPGGGCEATVIFGREAVVPKSGATLAGGCRSLERIDLSGVRILLAEDNPTNQIVASQMLGALNATVTLSSDGVEALEKFEAAPFDLVVVDIEMPRMSGLDVIREIRGRSDARARTPIVALTAYAMRDHRDRIASAGANGLISKPITSIESLGEALRGHVRPRPQTEDAGRDRSASGQSDDPVADLHVFNALCAAIGPGMMAELLEKVVADLQQAGADLEAAMPTLDRKAIRSASHILISVAGAIGAQRLQTCARTLNTAAHGEDSARLPEDLCRCIREVESAVAFAESRRTAGVVSP